MEVPLTSSVSEPSRSKMLGKELEWPEELAGIFGRPQLCKPIPMDLLKDAHHHSSNSCNLCRASHEEGAVLSVCSWNHP